MFGFRKIEGKGLFLKTAFCFGNQGEYGKHTKHVWFRVVFFFTLNLDKKEQFSDNTKHALNKRSRKGSGKGIKRIFVDNDKT